MDTEITASKPFKIDTTFNTRDLGGYKTKDGKTTKMHAFLRSDLPAQITDHSKKVLLDYGVRCVVDLRSLAEVNSMPNDLRFIPEIDYYSLPMLDQTTSQGFNGKMPDNMGTVSNGNAIDYLGKNGEIQKNIFLMRRFRKKI